MSGLTHGSAWRVRWWGAAIALSLICSGTMAGVWIGRQHRAPPSDECAVVEQLSHEWLAIVSFNNRLDSDLRGGDRAVEVADAERAMSAKLRAAADAVSSASLKDLLRQWADGAKLGADSRRTSNGMPTQASDDLRNYVQAAVTVYNATAALRKLCPNMAPPPEN